MAMSKALLGLTLFLFSVGCGSQTPTVEPTPESTPWLFPEPQIELLANDDFQVRGLAVKSLEKMGAKAEIAIPALEKLLEDKEPKIRVLAERALKTIREELGEAN